MKQSFLGLRDAGFAECLALGLATGANLIVVDAAEGGAGVCEIGDGGDCVADVTDPSLAACGSGSCFVAAAVTAASEMGCVGDAFTVGGVAGGLSAAGGGWGGTTQSQKGVGKGMPCAGTAQICMGWAGRSPVSCANALAACMIDRNEKTMRLIKSASLTIELRDDMQTA